MKKHALFFFLLTAITTSSIAQNLMVYCKMDIRVSNRPTYNGRLKKGEDIHIDLGNDSTSILNRNFTLSNQLKRVEAYSNSTDAMNYMSKLGWDLVHVVNVDPLNYIVAEPLILLRFGA